MRLVLDTNVWLDWLLFEDPGVEPLRAAHARGQIEIVVDAACDAELERVLGYPFQRRSLAEEERSRLLAACRGIARRVEIGEAGSPLRCRDADDEKFLALALAARVDALVSKDLALLELSHRGLPFRILDPAGAARALREEGMPGASGVSQPKEAE